MKRTAQIVVVGIALAFVTPTQASEPLRVVASILPVHALVASVMAGIGEPTLLVRPGASPHAYAMKPSEARMLSRADVVFWIGDEIESFLPGPLASLGKTAQVVSLNAAPSTHLLAAREGGVWEAHKGHHGFDPHTWLDSTNAASWVSVMADVLSEAAPTHRARLQANAKKTIARLNALDLEIRRAMRPVAHVPHMVFHDAYQYFEKRYGLNAFGALTIDPDRKPGARRIVELKAKIKEFDARCVFVERQFPPKIATTLVEGSNAHIGTLDPIGDAKGPGAYEKLIRGLAASFTACLSR